MRRRVGRAKAASGVVDATGAADATIGASTGALRRSRGAAGAIESRRHSQQVERRICRRRSRGSSRSRRQTGRIGITAVVKRRRGCSCRSSSRSGILIVGAAEDERRRLRRRHGQSLGAATK